MFCVLAYWKRRKVALTVDAGASVIFWYVTVKHRVTRSFITIPLL